MKRKTGRPIALWTEDRVAELARRDDEGQGPTAIAAAMGLSREQVKNALIRLRHKGLADRPPALPADRFGKQAVARLAAPTVWTGERIADLRAYVAAGGSAAEIARVMKLPVGDVAAAMEGPPAPAAVEPPAAPAADGAPKAWTAEADARLIGLYGQGLSYGAIALAMGRGSKNEIGGRLDRLAKKGLVEKQGRVFFRPRQDAAPARQPRGKRRAPPAPALVLGKQGCCWPLWNDRERPTHQYCGAPAIEGRPYCPEHHARAYTHAPAPNVWWAGAGGIDPHPDRPPPRRHPHPELPPPQAGEGAGRAA